MMDALHDAILGQPLDTTRPRTSLTHRVDTRTTRHTPSRRALRHAVTQQNRTSKRAECLRLVVGTNRRSAGVQRHYDHRYFASMACGSDALKGKAGSTDRRCMRQ
jgi:hypothetical protein